MLEGLKLNGDISEIWIRLSFFELQRSNFTAAIEAAEKARELEPDSPWSHTVLEWALALKGRTDEAEASYLSAIGIDPGQSLALTELASIRERRGS